MEERKKLLPDEESQRLRGMQPHHQMRPYLVMRCLMEETDENKALNGDSIVAKIKDTFGISAERRAIYRDIEEINLALCMLENNCDVDTAAEMLAEDEDLKYIAYRSGKSGERGYYMRRRRYALDDIKLLVECIYSARFIAKNQADMLTDLVSSFVSKEEAQRIKHNALLTDRFKTGNKQTLQNISTINDAMSKTLNGQKHIPERISFRYLSYSIDNVKNQIERRHGSDYTVSPYQLLINDGNYYLLAYNSDKKAIRTYRIDRMKNVKMTGEVRDGESAFREIDLHSYTRRTFSMFSGNTERVEIRFLHTLLDTVVERFGTEEAVYRKVDDTHFSVTAQVDISDQFYGWLLGFGKRAKLLAPEDAVIKLKTYIEKVNGMYD